MCGNGAEVLEALAQLVDVALVASAGDGRFLLHAAVRSYAYEKLAEADESEVFQRRHAAAFAETATSGAAGSYSTSTLSRPRRRPRKQTSVEPCGGHPRMTATALPDWQAERQ